jgi:nanoRNase/pAp phosphatase (c-di-AMP/oligoRNAs hydrolase)
MEKITGLAQFQQFLVSSQTVFILLPQDFNLDKVAAATSLYLSLEKAGKRTSIFCSKPMTVEFSFVVGINKIKSQLEGKDLVISFDYAEDSVEKVSYNIENNKFNLIIQAKEGYPPLSPQKVQYSYTGANADLFITLGASSLEDLGEIYFKNKKALDEGKVINLEKMDFQASCYCELVANFLNRFNFPADEDIADNLLAGLEKETDGFSAEKSGPETFEAAAFCLRVGGRRPQEKKSQVKEKPPKGKEEEIKKEEHPPDWLSPKIYKGNTLI